MIINLDGKKPDNVSQEFWDCMQKEFENIYNDESEVQGE